MANNFDILQDEAMRNGAGVRPGTKFKNMTSEQRKGFDEYMKMKIQKNPDRYRDDPRATKYLKNYSQSDFDTIRRKEMEGGADLNKGLYGDFWNNEDNGMDWAAENAADEEAEQDSEKEKSGRREQEQGGDDEDENDQDSTEDSDDSNPSEDDEEAGENGDEKNHKQSSESPSSSDQEISTADKPADETGKDLAKGADEAAAETGEAAAGLAETAEAASAAEAAAAAGATEVAAGTAGAITFEFAFWLIIGIVVFLLIVFLLMAIFKSGDKECATGSTSSSGTVIVLDPGHPSEQDVNNDGTPVKGDGGNNGGSGHGLTEPPLVFNIAKKLQPKLEAKGYKVVLTRNSENEYITNKARAEVANNNNAAFFFRIHTDDTDTPDNSGFFFMYPDKIGRVNGSSKGVQGPTQEVLDKSKSTTESLLSNVREPIKKLGLQPGKHNGIISESANGGNATHGGILLGSLFSKVPVSLIEIGNLDSPTESTWLKNDSNLDKLTTILADGISKAVPAANTTTASATGTTSSYTFPVKGSQKSFTGLTKGPNQPRGPSNKDMIKATDNFYQWPIPTDKGSASNNGEPAFGACRGDRCERKHKGVDIYTNFGAPVYAPEGGKITKVAGKAVYDATEAAGGGAGRHIVMTGDSGETYTFMHLEGFSDTVLKGAGLSDQIGNTEKTVSFAVKGGDVIGYVGNTGGIQNPHLHFQVGPSGSEKDPAPILDSWLSGAATPTRSSEACSTASPSGNSFGERVVNLARTQLGKAYIFGSCHGAVKSSPPPGGCSNYDCSSFVEWSWYWGTDKKFDPGGTTGEMWGNKDNTAKWSRITDIKQLQPGDILLRDGHVMLASGKGTWIEAPQTGDVVKESAIRESRLQKGNYVYLRPNIQ